jgi:3-hydroxy-9,10-secoandrosta-1,3,5(10)-triene-9,17-dione monooxygenase reductase component
MTSPLDPKALRQVFGQFCTGVTAVCVAGPDGRRYGITVNSFSSLSLDPPLALFAVVRESETLRAIQAAGAFSINILAENQQDISNALAKKGGPEKMDAVPTHPGVTGAPIIEGSIGYMDCVLHAVHEGGDHLIVVGEIKQAQVGEALPPLLYFRSGYKTLPG